MTATRRALRAAPRVARDDQATTTLVVGAAWALILAQLAFRGWALWRGYFFADDYNLLSDQADRTLTWGSLFEPYNGHVFPGGRFVVWAVAQGGTLNWGLAASLILLGQLLTSAAALWMLLTLFGRRPGVLVPLAVYLWSAATLPAVIWWSASLIQTVPQAALFAAVGCWVRYLRTRSPLWLTGSLGSVGAGLLFVEKSALILPVLAYLALAYFATGGPIQRVRSVVVAYWPAFLTAALLGGAYTVYYSVRVESVLSRPAVEVVGGLAEAMLGRAFTVGVLGGPWRWSEQPQPAAYADPPSFTVPVAWVLLGAMVAYLALRRTRTGRSWGLLAGYLTALYLLLLFGRASVFGASIGLDYRYLTDGVAVFALSLALASMPLIGAREPSQLRAEPVLRIEIRPAWVIVATGAVVVSGALSAGSYAWTWHETNASDAYVHTLRDDLHELGSVDLADTETPAPVIDHLNAPNNRVSLLARLVSAEVSFPEVTDRLAVVAEDGSVHRAEIDVRVRSRSGPIRGCGWLVKGDGLRIPLRDRAFFLDWWVRIGYLASDDSTVRIVAGDTTLRTDVDQGVNSLFLHITDSFSSIMVEDLDRGVTMCVDDIEVGLVSPGGRLG